MARCIGEEIKEWYEVFIIAIPQNLNDMILVSDDTLKCITFTAYYDDNTAKSKNAYETLKAALTPEWAWLHIPGYEEGMKLFPQYGCFSGQYNEHADKSNAKIRKKLVGKTVYEWMNGKLGG